MGGLLIGSTLFLITINYMADNIEDFESRPLPPPKLNGQYRPTIQ